MTTADVRVRVPLGSHHQHAPGSASSGTQPSSTCPSAAAVAAVGAATPSSCGGHLAGMLMSSAAAMATSSSSSSSGTTSSSVILPDASQLEDLDLSDRTLFAVYCFIKNFIGASGASAVAIDNKIEQAMDLVKSHLMFAVREEVEVLKDKIAELLERIAQLEQENSILKAHATQETLAQLTTSPLPSSSQSQETGTAV